MRIGKIVFTDEILPDIKNDKREMKKRMYSKKGLLYVRFVVHNNRMSAEHVYYYYVIGCSLPAMIR